MDNQNDEQNATDVTMGDVVSEAVPKYKPENKSEYEFSPSSLPFEEGKRYTYSDIQDWPEQIDGKFVRYELIDGIPFILSSPTRKHQGVLGELFVQLHNFLKGKPCKVYLAPFDIRFNAEGADNTVLQPDILVICDHSKLTDAGANGAPDMAIEVLSPSTARRDRLVKMMVYEKYGVREYWVVEPESQEINVYTLENGRFFVNTHPKANTISVNILKGCTIDLTEVFAE